MALFNRKLFHVAIRSLTIKLSFLVVHPDPWTWPLADLFAVVLAYLIAVCEMSHESCARTYRRGVFWRHSRVMSLDAQLLFCSHVKCGSCAWACIKTLYCGFSRCWEFMREGLRVECSNMNAATQQALLGIVAGYAAKVNKNTLFPIKKLGIEF